MIVLGIETSCDETSIAFVDRNTILSNIISSQAIHSEYGGVVPEYAAREHERQIVPIFQLALRKANIGCDEIRGIAVTRGPGLMGSLLTGLSFAKGFAFGTGLPLIGINHLEAHMYANLLATPDLDFPFLSLIVSGGHTLLVLVNGFREYTVLGSTRDDAAGEAFDKAAKILNLGYPGGPIIDELSKKGDPHFHKFPVAELSPDSMEFSFSGLKTSLLYLVRDRGESWVNEHLESICSSYQDAILNALLLKTKTALEKYDVTAVAVSGGVAANTGLRNRFVKELHNSRVVYPPMELCGDNGAMVAFLGSHYLSSGYSHKYSVTALPNLTLTL